MDRQQLHKKMNLQTSSSVKLHAKTHTYTDDKKRVYTSVTTLVHHFFPPFNEKEVAKKLVKIRKYQGIKTSARKILAEWRAIRDLGTKVHGEIEMSILGEQLPVYESRTEQALKFIESRKYVDMLPELLVWSTRYLVAGTCDLLVFNDDGTVSIVDWKTNTTIRSKAFNNEVGTHELTADIPHCNLRHYELQLNLYAAILEMEAGLVIKDLTLVHLLPDSYNAYDIPRKKELAMAVLEEWRKNLQTKN